MKPVFSCSLCVDLQGIIEPHSVYDLPLIIEAQALEEQDILAQIAIFGSPDPPMVSVASNRCPRTQLAYIYNVVLITKYSGTII